MSGTRLYYFNSAVSLVMMCAAAAAQIPCGGYAFGVSGQILFAHHCAGCHGFDGTGKGPLARNQNLPPADLTELKRLNRGIFPAQRLAAMIRSGGDLLGHGNGPLLPAWGKVFSSECGPAYSRRAIVELKRYLEAIQK
jgi:mono/diheme cytochrome c family protein